MGELPGLSLTEWMVLALVDESPAHGFALASLTAQNGALGRVWHVPRPVVYRSLTRLVNDGLVQPTLTERGTRGPNRTIVAATESGSVAVNAWLVEPIAHFRDVRSELLVKLALLNRRGTDPRALLAEQRAVMTPMATALRDQVAGQSGFARTIAALRSHNADAVLAFLDDPAVSDPDQASR